MRSQERKKNDELLNTVNKNECKYYRCKQTRQMCCFVNYFKLIVLLT